MAGNSSAASPVRRAGNSTNNPGSMAPGSPAAAAAAGTAAGAPTSGKSNRAASRSRPAAARSGSTSSHVCLHLLLVTVAASVTIAVVFTGGAPTRGTLQTNWDSGVTFAPAVRREWPSNVEAVVALVKECVEYSKTHVTPLRLKVVGAGHSWSDVAQPVDIMVSLDRMDQIVAFDPTTRQLTVQAGARLNQIIAYAARLPEPLGFPSLPSVTEQSIAGLISTGTHGNAPSHANIPSSIVELEMVTGTGDVVRITRSDPRYHAVGVSLGALGIITSVTLQLVPAFAVEEVRRPIPYAEFFANIDSLTHDSDFVKFWMVPHTDTVAVYSANRTTKALAEPWQTITNPIVGTAFGFAMWVGSQIPSLIPAINHVIARVGFTPMVRVAPSQHVLPVPFPLPAHNEMEYLVPRQHSGRVLQALTAGIKEHNLVSNMAIEIRPVVKDEFWLSMAYQQDMMAITVGGRGLDAENQARYYRLLEQLATEVGGRPHWAKAFGVTAKQLSAMYPRWNDFQALRKTLDPHGVFWNPFLSRVLGSYTE